ncbi:MAG: NAD(P)-dependent oxidoreductase [Syntrophomonadaceae bacterium]|jgi:nucleoside-diphosphate-sugar epimerase|nr:NAD(P)-dependent oxidoreductase [Syntrophomonadaceae bacterium]
MTKVLVTGAAGFLGQHVAEFLSGHGYEVYGTFRRTPAEIPGVHMFRRDLSKDPLEINAELDAVIHCAAEIRGKSATEHIEGNITAMRNLIDFARKNAVGKFVFCSSTSVYGEVTGEASEESDRINPDLYAMSKYIGELLAAQSSLNSVYNLRLPRLLGKRIDFTYPWIPALSYKLLHSEEVNYFNPEIYFNNLIHVDDVNSFLLKLLKKDARETVTLNIGTKDKMKIIDVLHTLKKGLRSGSKLLETVAPARQHCYSVCVNKALERGFDPMSIEETLKRYCTDITEND